MDDVGNCMSFDQECAAKVVGKAASVVLKEQVYNFIPQKSRSFSTENVWPCSHLQH